MSTDAMRSLNQPYSTMIEHKGAKFLITDQPSDDFMDMFIEEYKKNRVSNVIRVNEPAYNKELLEEAGIKVHDFYFEDGSPPPDDIVSSWHQLVKRTLFAHGLESVPSEERPAVAVHCKAGLGRAPVLVAISLVEMGMRCEDAIALIRSKRSKAFNRRQIEFLEKFRPKKSLKRKRCSVM